jgi:hypothetical protein
MCALAASSVDPAQAEMLPLFSRQVRERLSPTALGLVLAQAEIFVEGGAARGTSAGGVFLGSAMLTIDLPSLQGRLRAPLDEETAQRLTAALADDAEARAQVSARVLEVARARLSAAALRVGELRVRAEGARVLVDVELEGAP